MTRSTAAGSWGRVLTAALFLIVLAAPAGAGDWQPITGSQSQTVPQPPNPNGGSGGGGYGGIPTWGRGGGYSGEPDHPHPPVTPAPTQTANCSLRFDPPTAQAGEYASVVATLPGAVLRDLGRLDLVVGGQVVAGVNRQGGSVSYAFRVPTGGRQIEASLTVYAARTGNYGQIRTLCTASASLTVMDLLLQAPVKVREGGLVSAAATVVGGTPPYRFEWFPSARVQGRGSESTYFNNFNRAGPQRISVSVTDAAGRRLSRAKQVEIVACAGLKVAGPQVLKSGERGTWTATYRSPFPPSRIVTNYGGSSVTYPRSSNPVWTFSLLARPEATGMTVTAEDQEGCTATVSFPVRVVDTPAPPMRSDAGSSTGGCRDIHGCACSGGGRTWQLGQTCCGSVICQPGTRCVSSGVCR